MARVTRPGGRVAANVWDYAGGTGPLTVFWSAVHDLDPASRASPSSAGTREGHLAALLREAGLREVTDGRVGVTSSFATFEEWWEPYTYGVGPAGAYVASLDARRPRPPARALPVAAARAAVRGRGGRVGRGRAWCEGGAVTGRPSRLIP